MKYADTLNIYIIGFMLTVSITVGHHRQITKAVLIRIIVN